MANFYDMLDNPTARAVGERAVVKRLGVNLSEQHLGRLAAKSFLSLWSYPSIFRNQKADKSGDGKEVCDLLVVFDEHIIIFSDKDIEYQTDQPAKTAWIRWYKRAVKASAAQIYGAERWIKTYPNQLFLDSGCTQPLPVQLPPSEDIKIHRIVVARGTGAACTKFFNGDRGSLILDNSLQGDDHTSMANTLPFTIGEVDANKGFVHVLDDVTLNILLTNLNTTTDFVRYLEKKENLFRSGRRIFAAGEEELLGHFLSNADDDGTHGFKLGKSIAAVAYDTGIWDYFQAHPDRLAQLEADQVSYLWDELIERFSVHVLGDSQYFRGESIEPLETELALRWMAREDRVQRRMLAQRLWNIAMSAAKNPKEPYRAGMTWSGTVGSPLYVMLVCNFIDGADDYEEYRHMRANLLHNYVVCAKVKNPLRNDIVGIALSSPLMKEASEDLIYLDASEWTNTEFEEAAALQKRLGIFQRGKIRTMNIEEYPKQQKLFVKAKEGERNKSCPCGTGRKYKHCCGKAR